MDTTLVKHIQKLLGQDARRQRTLANHGLHAQGLRLHSLSREAAALALHAYHWHGTCLFLKQVMPGEERLMERKYGAIGVKGTGLGGGVRNSLSGC